MKISSNGIDFIKQREGIRLDAYKCTAGVWTIGYGHTKGVKKGDKITEKQAEEFLESDLLAICEKPLSSFLEKNRIELNQNQYDAICSFIFNVGFNNFLSSSIARGLINREQKQSIANYFSKWVKVKKCGIYVIDKGLQNRRKLEIELFMK